MKSKVKKEIVFVSILLLVALACAFVNFYKSMNSDIIEHSLGIVGNSIAMGRLTLVIVSANWTANGTIFLAPGWNLVSIQPQLLNYSIEQVLSNISGQYEYILEWNGTSQDFRLWSRNGMKQFLEFDMNKSYFIFYTASNTTLNFTGQKFNDYNIVLLVGWEAPVYPYEYDSAVSGSVFYSMPFDYMLTWNRNSQEFMVYSIYSASPQFNSIPAGDGYFIRTEGGTIQYVRV